MDERIAAAERLLKAGQVDEAVDRLLPLREVPEARRALGRAPAWRLPEAGPGRTRAVDAAPITAPPRALWSASLGAGTTAFSLGPLGALVVAPTARFPEHELVALDLDTGAPRWRRDAMDVRWLLPIEDAVLVQERERLARVDAWTGEVRAALTPSEGSLFPHATTLEDEVFIWAPFEGGLRRLRATGAGALALDPGWSHDGRVGLLGSARGRLVVDLREDELTLLVDPTSGRLASEVHGTFVAGDEGMLVVRREDTLVALTSASKPAWRLRDRHLLALGRAHVVTRQGRVGAVHSRAGGHALKHLTLPRPAAAIARDVAYVVGDDTLRAIDADGQALWSFSAVDCGGAIAALLAWHRRLLVLTTGGRLTLLG